MSIRLRLALWHTAILAVILMVFSSGLYWLMLYHLDNMAESAVVSRAQYIVDNTVVLGTESSPRLVFPPLDAFQSPEVYAEVMDASDNVLGRSANLGVGSLPGDELAFLSAHNGRAASYAAQLQGQKLRLHLIPIMSQGKVVGIVQVAAPYRQSEAVLTQLRLLLIVAGGIGLALALISGLALARRTLRPIADITETARAISTSRSFSRRLKEPATRDELGMLAVTFNEMLSSLEATYAAQRRFVGDASHELRTPLTTIRGNLELLENFPDMPKAERDRALADARQEVERLSRMVSDLLSIARADAGQRMAANRVELDAILLDVYRQAASRPHAANLSLDKINEAMVIGDADRLKQLVLILLDNAQKYTPAGGRISLSLTREGYRATLTVADTGMGIQPADLPHIFDRFYRSASARTLDPTGSGLGLSIAKWIVEQHGGEIKVNSTPGQGSRFTVRLPLAA